MSKYWGYHAQYDCAKCDVEKITSKENIYNFTKYLIEAIDMKGYGEPIIEYFAEHDVTKAGYTMLALIETSNLSAHFVDSDGSAFVDIFSCKDFDTKTGEDIIKEYFNPKAISSRKILRNVPSVD